MGQMEMKCIFDIGIKNISVLAKATQVSDVAHGPLVCLILDSNTMIHVHVNILFQVPRHNYNKQIVGIPRGTNCILL
jgi:hypothetical protein